MDLMEVFFKAIVLSWDMFAPALVKHKELIAMFLVGCFLLKAVDWLLYPKRSRA